MNGIFKMSSPLR